MSGVHDVLLAAVPALGVGPAARWSPSGAGLAALIVITTVDFEKGFAFSESHGGVLPLSPKTAAAALKDQDAANTQNAQKGTDSAVTSGHQGS